MHNVQHNPRFHTCHAQDSVCSEGHPSWKVFWAEASTWADKKGVTSSQEVAHQYLQKVIHLHKCNAQNSSCEELRSNSTNTQYSLQTSNDFQVSKFDWLRVRLRHIFQMMKVWKLGWSPPQNQYLLSLRQVVALVLTCTTSVSWTLQSTRNGNLKMYKPLRYFLVQTK